MPRFEDIFMETIKEVICNVFDGEVSGMIFSYLKESSSRRPEDVAQVFTEVLPKILGIGHVIIEDLVIETLYSKYGRRLQWKKGYGFKDYILELKSQTEEMAVNEAQSRSSL